jgi:protein TonB
MAPKPLEGKNPAPVYPEASRLAGESGVVVVRVTVSEEGMPVEMRIEESSSFTRLDAAAVEAAARWRFKPGTWQGKPVELDILVPFRFGLKEPAKP